MSTPAGWYPDPTDTARVRWWDGERWSQETAEAPAAAVAAPVADEPVAPVAEPVVPAAEPAATAADPTRAAPASAPAQAGTPAPRYGEYAPTPTVPTYPVAPVAPAAPPYGGAPASGYGTYGGYAPRRPSAWGVDTNTIWIYLMIVVTTLPVFSLFAVDMRGYFEAALSFDNSGEYAPGAASEILSWTGRMFALSALGFLAQAIAILFAWLDYRELRRRGVAQPFNWAFAFFTLIVGVIVYVIGRTVVLKRETGQGLAPLWVWIGSVVLSIIVAVSWYAALVQQLMPLILDYSRI